jgi:hypothetical protein
MMDETKSGVTTSDLTQCAESVRIGWGLMLAGEGQIAEGKAQWVEGVLKAAEAIVTARDALKNDAAFGKWCSDNSFSLRVIDKDNRAALIRVGRNLPYWRTRLPEAKGQSLRYVIKDALNEEDGGIAAAAIPQRHETKPGPKPADTPSADEVAEFERLVEEGRKVVVAAKADAATERAFGKAQGEVHKINAPAASLPPPPQRVVSLSSFARPEPKMTRVTLDAEFAEAQHLIIQIETYGRLADDAKMAAFARATTELGRDHAAIRRMVKAITDALDAKATWH